MIACLIEFAVAPGREAEHAEWLSRLLPRVAGQNGFISKETFDSRNSPGKLFTVSYWDHAEGLEAWMRDPEHRHAMRAGRNGIFSSYQIRICEVQREYGFAANA
jgi:heme-degrading monooxygenase HmoA